ncbi:MAG: polysaccharide biosynthesis/export family protein, partial [Pseudomonadota bacterium]
MALKLWGALAAIGLLGACSALPAQGPSASTVAEAPSPLVVVDIDEGVIGALEGVPVSGLGDTFATNGTGAALSIAVGDIVNVTIYETISDDLVSGLFNGSILPPQVVPRSGRIKIPFAGSVRVAGRSAEAVSAEIAQRLQEKTIDPDVL